MAKIGIFGGTFNPIHFGHLHIAKHFAQSLALDSVLLVPTKAPTHKVAKELAPAKDRLAMCQLAVENTPFVVSDIEIQRIEPSYTVYTLAELHKQMPEDTLYLLMGEDMFLTLEHWIQPEEICKLAVICSAPRSASMQEMEQYAKTVQQLGGTTVLIPMPFLPISSTMVRQHIATGQSITELVPPKVAEYIYQHGLYERSEQL